MSISKDDEALLFSSELLSWEPSYARTVAVYFPSASCQPAYLFSGEYLLRSMRQCFDKLSTVAGSSLRTVSPVSVFTSVTFTAVICLSSSQSP